MILVQNLGDTDRDLDDIGVDLPEVEVIALPSMSAMTEEIMNWTKGCIRMAHCR